VLSGWQGTQAALPLDATTLGTRFIVLAISGVSRGCAIPVAWAILPANVPPARRREWLCMLRQQPLPHICWKRHLDEPTSRIQVILP
jgi:hypothetical protein